MPKKNTNPSKAMKVWKPNEKYIREVQATFKFDTPQEAINEICAVHAEAVQTPLERAQARIREAADLLDNEDQKLFLAYVNRVLTYQDRALKPARDSLVDLFQRFDEIDKNRARQGLQETLDGQE